jgi:hypothetical protein
VERAGLAAALDQADHGALVRQAGLAALGALGHHVLVAEVGLVGLDDLALAAQAAGIVRRAVHRRPDAVRHEPRRLVRQVQHAVELVGADALLRRGHEVRCQHPLVQREMAALVDRPDGDGEVLAAGRASVQSRPRALAL